MAEIKIEDLVQLQRDFWTPGLPAPDPGPSDLTWPERQARFRQSCLSWLKGVPQELETTPPEGFELQCQAEGRELFSRRSPFAAVPALVWQSEEEEPDLQGWVFNPSLTHLGSLEVVGLNSDLEPTNIELVPLGSLRALILDEPNLFRMARLLFRDEQERVVLLPMLYGLSWHSPSSHDQDGGMTRFLYPISLIEDLPRIGIGVGQQDLLVGNESNSLIGLSSVRKVFFPDPPKEGTPS